MAARLEGLEGHRLGGLRVPILAADMVERVLIEPRKALEDAGAATDLISLERGAIEEFSEGIHADRREKVEQAR